MPIPRLSLDDMPADLADMLRPRVARLGYLGEFFRCAAHQPAALASFMRFTEDLKTALPDRLTELVALTVSAVMNNAYERHQHERLSLTLGFSEGWIREVLTLGADERQAMTVDERRVQQFVIDVVELKGHATRPLLESIAQALGPAQAIAILMLVGRYVTHALIVNSLALEPPVPSPLQAAGSSPGNDASRAK